MQERRAFMKSFAGAVAGGFLDIPQNNPQNFDALWNEGGKDEFWKELRKSFPLNIHKTYFNNGTFGPSPFPVLAKIKEKLEAMATTGEYGDINPFRTDISRLLQVDKEEIALTHNTTEGINIAAWAIPLKAGDEVILTTEEHVGNALPWLNVARQKGIKLRTFEPSSTSEEVLTQIKQLMNKNTRVIAIPHITCTTGQVLPVFTICELALNNGLYSAIDGAHGAGTMSLNLKTMNCDFYAGCCHKWLLGPAGTGFLYVRKSLVEKLEPHFVGAFSDTGWSLLENEYGIKGFSPNAHRFDYGTQNAALFEGASEAVRFIEKIGINKIQERLCSLSTYLHNKLQSSQNKLDLLTPEEEISRISMVTFRPKKINYIEFNSAAIKEGFRVRAVPENNLNAIRVSTHIYNTFDEIDRFTEFCKSVL